MGQLFLGKINLSKIDKTKLFEGKTGKWMDITVWFNEQPDEYGNNLSIEQSTKKGESKIFIGNAKFYTPKEEDKAAKFFASDKEGPQAKGEYVKGGKVNMKALSDIDDLAF